MAGINYGQLLENATFSTRGGLLPEGTYTAEIKEAEVKETANGNPKISTTFVVVEGEEAGRKVFNDIVTPREGSDEKARKAAGFFFDKLFALGLSREFVQTVQTNEQLASALLGKRADIVVFHDVYNGKTRPKVRYINPPSVPAPTAPGGPIPVGGFTPPAAATAPGAFTPPPAAPPATGFAPPPIGTLMAPPAAPPAVPAPTPPQQAADDGAAAVAAAVPQPQQPQPVDF